MFRYLETLVDPYAPYEETDHPPQRLGPFMRQYMAPFRTVFIWAGTLSVIGAMIEVWLIYYLGQLVDALDFASRDSFWSEQGFELAMVALFILLIRPGVAALQTGFINQSIIPNFGTIVRWRAHRHVLRQSVGWFEDDFAGRIANRIMQTPPAAGEVVFQVFDAITFAIAYLVGAMILLATADPRLIVPLLAWLIPYLFMLRWTILRIGPASQRASDARSAVTGRVVDSYTNIHSVKMFAHHDREVDYAKEAIEKARYAFQMENRLYTIMDLALVVLNGILILGVVGWALYLWTGATASVGIVAAATALTLRLNGMSGWIMWAISNFFRNLGVVAEGMETIAQPIALVDAPNAVKLTVPRGEIVVDGVSHHYGKSMGGLERIDLRIAPGEKIGLVGASGAGKSTLIKLLLRFYDAEAGDILIDGQSIRNVTQDSLRQNIGMVQQDSALLHRSVRENILYGNPNATEEQVVAAAKQAAAHDFILELEDMDGNTGYDSRVGERGVKLSGGQRQRIALARVILKNAPILMLDEATSALDSEVEAAIQSTLEVMMTDKTVIAIAHRLSTIARMDRIIVMEDGRIVEEGTHASLLAQEGRYAQFWHRQSGGFIATEAAE